MSDSESDATVLGKRSRNGEEPENGRVEDVEEQRDQMDTGDDDDDDDVGPMPMPAGAEGRVAKKKRKGTLCMLDLVRRAALNKVCSPPSREALP